MFQSNQQKFAWTVLPSRLSNLVMRPRINLIKSTNTLTVLEILLRLTRTKVNVDWVFLSYVSASLRQHHSPDLPHCSSPHILYTVHDIYLNVLLIFFSKLDHSEFSYIFYWVQAFLLAHFARLLLIHLFPEAPTKAAAQNIQTSLCVYLTYWTVLW